MSLDRLWGLLGQTDGVIDADTVRLDESGRVSPDGEPARIYGMDAPEVGMAGDREAVRYLRSVLEETGFERTGDKDRYGRDVVNAQRGNNPLSEDMIRAGVALPTRDFSTEGDHAAYRNAFARQRIADMRTDVDERLMQDRADRPVRQDVRSLSARGLKPKSRSARAWDRGFANLRSSLGAAQVFLGEQLDSEWLRAAGNDRMAQGLMEATLNPADVEAWEDVDSLSTVGAYIQERVIENIPTMLPMIGGGAAGGALGGLARAGVAKSALRSATSATAAQEIRRSAAKWGVTSAWAAGYPQHMGEGVLELMESEVELSGVRTPYLTAAVNSFLDVAPATAVLAYAFKGLRPDLAKHLVKSTAEDLRKKGLWGQTLQAAGNVLREGGKGLVLGAAVEGPTEWMQELVNQTARAYYDPEYDIYSDEAQAERTEAFIAGMTVGGVLGGAGRGAAAGVRELRGQPVAQEEEPPASEPPAPSAPAPAPPAPAPAPQPPAPQPSAPGPAAPDAEDTSSQMDPFGPAQEEAEDTTSQMDPFGPAQEAVASDPDTTPAPEQTVPEPAADIQAQLEELAADDTPGRARFFATLAGVALPTGLASRPAADRSGVYVYRRGDAKARRDIARTEKAKNPAEARAKLLGYQQTKGEAVASGEPIVVQGKTEEGAVVHEEAVDGTDDAVVVAAGRTAEARGASTVELRPPAEVIADRAARQAEASESADSYRWQRRAPGGVELSSRGDRRFSALHARLGDGRTIEEAYQLDIKGYREQGDNWRLGKGKPPLRDISPEDQWQQYKALWQQYLAENPGLLAELRENPPGTVFTDQFATTDVNQARAISEILNDLRQTEATPRPAAEPEETDPVRATPLIDRLMRSHAGNEGVVARVLAEMHLAEQGREATPEAIDEAAELIERRFFSRQAGERPGADELAPSESDLESGALRLAPDQPLTFVAESVAPARTQRHQGESTQAFETRATKRFNDMVGRLRASTRSMIHLITPQEAADGSPDSGALAARAELQETVGQLPRLEVELAPPDLRPLGNSAQTAVRSLIRAFQRGQTTRDPHRQAKAEAASTGRPAHRAESFDRSVPLPDWHLSFRMAHEQGRSGRPQERRARVRELLELGRALRDGAETPRSKAGDRVALLEAISWLQSRGASITPTDMELVRDHFERRPMRKDKSGKWIVGPGVDRHGRSPAVARARTSGDTVAFDQRENPPGEDYTAARTLLPEGARDTWADDDVEAAIHAGEMVLEAEHLERQIEGKARGTRKGRDPDEARALYTRVIQAARAEHEAAERAARKSGKASEEKKEPPRRGATVIVPGVGLTRVSYDSVRKHLPAAERGAWADQDLQHALDLGRLVQDHAFAREVVEEAWAGLPRDWEESSPGERLTEADLKALYLGHVQGVENEFYARQQDPDGELDRRQFETEEEQMRTSLATARAALGSPTPPTPESGPQGERRGNAKWLTGLLEAAQTAMQSIGLKNVPYTIADAAGIKDMVSRLEAALPGLPDGQVKTLVEENIALLRQALEDSPDGRVVWLHSLTPGGRRSNALNPVILIGKGLQPGRRAHVLMHELGHVSMRYLVREAPAETRKALLEALGGKEEFSENFADLFSRWFFEESPVRQQLLESLTTEGAAAKIDGLFRQVLDALRGLWKALRKRVGDEAIDTFSDFMRTWTGFVNFRPVAPRSTAGKAFHAALAEKYGKGGRPARPNDYLTRAEVSAKSEDFSARRFFAGAKRHGSDVGRAMATVYDSFIRAEDSALRRMARAGSTAAQYLADNTHRAPRTQSTDPRPMMKAEVAGTEARFFAQLEPVFAASRPGGVFREARPSPELVRATEELIQGRPESPLAKTMRQTLDDAYDWLKEKGVLLRKEPHFWPRGWDATEVAARADEFRGIVRDWAATPEAQKWLRRELGDASPGTAAAYAKGLQQALTSTSNVMAEVYDPRDADAGDLEIIAPGFSSAKGRKIPRELAKRLEGFQSRDPVDTLQRYIRTAVRRGLWQERFGANDTAQRLIRLMEGATPATMDAARKEFDRVVKFWRDTYGTSPFDPSAGLRRMLIDDVRSGKLSQGDFERVLKRTIPGYQGILGAQQTPPLWRRTQALAVVYQNLRVLSLAVFTQFTDPGMMAARLPKGRRAEFFREGLRGLVSGRTRADLRRDARAIGLWADDITDHILNDSQELMLSSQRLHRVNEAFFRWNGQQLLTNVWRAAGVSAGKRLVAEWAAEGNRATLEELGIDVDSARAWADAGSPMAWGEGHDQVLGGIHQLVGEGILRPDAQTRPWVGNDHRFQVFWHLHSFTWQYATNILGRVWTESKKRWGEEEGARKALAALPALALAAWTLPLAALGMEMRWLLAPPQERPDGGWEYFWETAQRSGILGTGQMLVDMGEADAHGQIAPLAVLGPTAGQMMEFFLKDMDTVLPRALPAYPLVRSLRGALGDAE